MKAIYPAIDLIEGKVVRLEEGQFDSKKTYSENPIEIAQGFSNDGAKYLHIVDLDGARYGQTMQSDLIKQICAATQLKVQVGGGIRTIQDVEKLLNVGVDRIIIGSLAVKDPEAFSHILSSVGGDRITLGLDCHLDASGQAHVATQGWQETSNTTANNLLDQYRDLGLRRVLCTDIKKDGMLQGPNFDLYKSLSSQYPEMEFLASGGVSCKEDILNLNKTGAYGVIIGKALYENRIKLEEIL